MGCTTGTGIVHPWTIGLGLLVEFGFVTHGSFINLKGVMNMLAYIKTWASLSGDRRAVTALEYAMIAGIVVAVIAVGFGYLASDMQTKFNSIGSNL